MKNASWFKTHSYLGLLIIGILCSSSIHGQTQKKLENSLIQLTEKLRADSNKVFLKSLEATDKELMVLFEDSVFEKVVAYNKDMWSRIDQVSDNSMKPLSVDAGVRLLYSSTEKLKLGELGGLPEEYLGFHTKLKAKTFIFGIQYLDSDGNPEKTRSAFFYVNDRWVIIPLAYRAFH